jgi:hypothetical protein
VFVLNGFQIEVAKPPVCVAVFVFGDLAIVFHFTHFGFAEDESVNAREIYPLGDDKCFWVFSV